MKVYEYSNCTTCKKALKFLDTRKVKYEKIAIKEHPPTVKDLKEMLGHLGGQIKKLFNTSGQVYREMELSKKLPDMTEAQALKLLASNGMLVKRPFVLSNKGGVVGFKEVEWKKLLNA